MTPLNTQDVLIRIGQLIIGIIFATAGLHKLRDIQLFIRRVRGYALLDQHLIFPASLALVVCELCVGALLLIGWQIAPALWGAAVLIGLFVGAIAINLARHRTIRCGCFADDERISPLSLLRLGLMLLAVIICLAVGSPAPDGRATLLPYDPATLFDYTTLLCAAGGVILVASLLLEWLGALAVLRAGASASNVHYPNDPSRCAWAYGYPRRYWTSSRGAICVEVYRTGVAPANCYDRLDDIVCSYAYFP